MPKHETIKVIFFQWLQLEFFSAPFSYSLRLICSTLEAFYNHEICLYFANKIYFKEFYRNSKVDIRYLIQTIKLRLKMILGMINFQ